MNIEPTYLKECKKLVMELKHSEIIIFFKPLCKPGSIWTNFYWAFNFLIIGYLIFFLIAQRTLTFVKYFDQIALGFALFFFILLPIHELIHEMVYKIYGAKQVKYKADFRKFIFYAMADNFVTNRNEITRVAIAPFIVINLLLFLLFATLCEPYRWLPYGAIIVHTAGCFGDFALVNYFYQL